MLNKGGLISTSNKQYSYNSWFGENSENYEIYEESVKPIILSSLDGINGTVFMYGQTGSGKTYTMLGDYSKEIRENSWLSKRSSSNKMRIRSGSRNHSTNQTESLKRNCSYGSLPGKAEPGVIPKPLGLGLHKQTSLGTPKGLPPKANCFNQPSSGSGSQSNRNLVKKSTTSEIEAAQKSEITNAVSFESYIKNWQQYSLTPKRGSSRLQRNQSEAKLKGGSNSVVEELQNKGVLIYSLSELFNQIENYSTVNKSLEEDSKEYDKNIKTNTFIVKCSYFEIYNDTVYDLLSDINEIDKPLIVWEDPKKKDFLVKGIVEVVVDTLDECLDILKIGEYSRHYAATSMNHQSSRSHTIFRLWIQNIENSLRENSSFDSCYSLWKESILNFIDLAGSEKVSNHLDNKTESKGLLVSDSIKSTNIQERVNEGKHINKSLFFLTQVISLKAKGNSDHIPFRNSPLTKILRSSLGGNSRTAIILWATPTISQYEQTLSTLRFGSSAKKIENKITVNITKSSEDESLKAVISDYESKLRDFEGNKEIISELKQQKENLKIRLQKAMANNIENMNFSQPRQQKLADDAIIHWRNLGIINSCTSIGDIFNLTKIHSGWKIACWDANIDSAFVSLINQKHITSLKAKITGLKTAAIETREFAEKLKLENDTLKAQLK